MDSSHASDSENSYISEQHAIGGDSNLSGSINSKDEKILSLELENVSLRNQLEEQNWLPWVQSDYESVTKQFELFQNTLGYFRKKMIANQLFEQKSADCKEMHKLRENGDKLMEKWIKATDTVKNTLSEMNSMLTGPDDCLSNARTATNPFRNTIIKGPEIADPLPPLDLETLALVISSVVLFKREDGRSWQSADPVMKQAKLMFLKF